MVSMKKASVWAACTDAAMDAESQGDMQTAEKYYKWSLLILEKSWGPNNELVARALIDLADLYVDLNRRTEAELLYRRAMDTYEALFGKDNLVSGMIMRLLAELYISDNRVHEAAFLRKRAEQIMRRAV